VGGRLSSISTAVGAAVDVLECRHDQRLCGVVVGVIVSGGQGKLSGQ
jgi:hypothetical protein